MLSSRFRRARDNDWRTTTGTVLSASVQVGTSGPRRVEQPLVLYAYQVDGQAFQGDRVQASLPATSVVDQCPAGSSVQVFYDPADPARSTLQL
jgi:hypothetical protein